MSFDEFINKWNGKGIDTDGAFGFQCMDLMHKYVEEVLGLTDPRILAAPIARQVYENFDNVFGHGFFTRIPNTPTGVPLKGDIFFWGSKLGPAGHVAIFMDGDVNAFRSFDQNFPLGSKCHIQNHNYNGALGWLRIKNAPMNDTQKVNAITVIMQSPNSDTDKVRDSKKVLGL